MSYPAPHLEIDTPKDFFSVNLPKLTSPASVKFVLGYHGTAEDFPLSLKDDFNEADIVLHEQIGWTQDGADAMDKTARGGEVGLYDDVEGINRRKSELLKDTQVRNGFWDVPFGHLSTPEFYQFFGGMHGLSTAEWYSKYVDMVLRRDKIALRTIGRTIDRLGDDIYSPRVLIIAGLSHVALANCYKANFKHTEIMAPYPNIEINNAAQLVISSLKSRLTS
ncbi:MAG: hypothetical protein WBB33_02705 [Candidatus Saccharimonadales bacterium]